MKKAENDENEQAIERKNMLKCSPEKVYRAHIIYIGRDVMKSLIAH